MSRTRGGPSNPLPAVLKSWNRKLTALSVEGIFFPQRLRLGLDARELTPKLVEKIVFAGAESRSMKRAKIVLDKVGDVTISISTIERILHDVGLELKDLRECAPSRLPKSLVPPLPAGPPKLAVVMADGGRMMTRQPGHGRGVHDQAWRETKNASFESMSHQTFENDPQPEIPQCFTEPKHVAEISGMAPLDVKISHTAKKQRRAPESEQAASSHDASMIRSDDATQNDNAVGTDAAAYVYAAAVLIHGTDHQAAWTCYLRWAQACWSGNVGTVIPELHVWLQSRGLDPAATLDEKHPDKAVHDAHRYLTNNASRMDYPAQCPV